MKRKIRNYVQISKVGVSGYDIFIKEKAILNDLIDESYEDESVKEKDKKGKKNGEQVDAARKFMCAKYYDIRTFGAVMTTGKNAGQVRGPIQLTFARSVDPIVSMEHSITRVAITKKEDADKRGEMGRKSTVPYGLYRCHGFISANLAKQTGFSEEDLNLFWEALKNMFDCDRSASRGLMSTQKLIVFRHDSELGNAPANKLFDLVTVQKKCEGAARSFADYEVSVDASKLPEHVHMEELI